MTRLPRRGSLEESAEAPGFDQRRRLDALEARVEALGEELEALRDGVRAVLRLVEHVHACPPEQAAAGVPPSAAPGRVPAAVAASRLGVSIATVRRLVAGGELAGCALRVPGRKRRAWYVDADALAALEPGRVALGATGARTPAVPPPRE